MRALWIVLLTCSCALAQDALFVSNAASGVSSIFAPGSLIEADASRPIVGSGPPPLITEIRIQVQGSGQTFDGQLINPGVYSTLAVVPDGVPAGPAMVSLLFQDGDVISTPVTVAPAAPAVFTASGEGSGPAVAQNYAIASQPAPNQLTNPALPGQYVTLWATGLGALTAPDVTVNISGIAVPASFAGPAPGQPGVDQINFQVPGGLATGCYTPVTVTAGSSISNAVTISTSKGGPCTHPLGLSVGQMKALDEGSGIRLGAVSFTGYVQPPASQPSEYSRYESISASFEVQDAYSVFLISQTPSGGTSCSIVGSAVLTLWRSLDPTQPPPAGPSLVATGPSGNVVTLTPSLFDPLFGLVGPYSTQFSEPAAAATPDQLPPPVLSPGPWQITVPGGPVIGAFQQSYSLPPQISIANRESVATISRSVDVPVIWNPQGYSSDAVVTASLSSGTTTLTCAAPANAGQLVMPASLLQQMPPHTLPPPVVTPAAISGTLTLSVQPKNPTIFGIPVIGCLDAPLLFSYFFRDWLNLTVQ